MQFFKHKHMALNWHFYTFYYALQTKHCHWSHQSTCNYIVKHQCWL